jgi:hypothetical protein
VRSIRATKPVALRVLKRAKSSKNLLRIKPFDGFLGSQRRRLIFDGRCAMVRAGTSPSVNYPTGATLADLTTSSTGSAADATVRSISGAGKRHPSRPEIRCSIDRVARHVVAISTLAPRRVTRRETLSDDDLDTVEFV